MSADSAYAAPAMPADAGAKPVRKRLTIVVVAFGALMTTLDATVVNVALPVIREDFGYLKVSVSQLQWVVNAYTLTYAAFLLVGGKLGDIFGRRRMFLAGLVLFVGASIVCGRAGTIDVLIALRAVQGVGAALLTPCSLSILTATFPPEERGLALGIWSGVLGIGVALGPLVGGLLVDQASWRWVFYINVPIGVAVFAATLAWVSESKDPTQKRRLDVGGVAASLIGLFALTFGLLKGNDYGWTDPRTIALIGGGIAALVAFVLIERAQREPMLPLGLFQSRMFAGANIIAVFAGFVLFGQLFFGSLLLQTVMGYSALKTGLALLPLTVLILVVSPPVGRMMSRGVNPRWLVFAGMILLADSLVLLSRIGFGSDFWDVLPAFVLAGIGFGLALTSLTAAALAGLPVRHAGIGSAVINTTRQAGGTLGLAITVAISTAVASSWVDSGRTRPDAFVHSCEVVMLVSAAVGIAGALVAVFTLGERPEASAEARAVARARPTVVDEPVMGLSNAHLALVIESGQAAGLRVPVRKELVVGRAEPEPGPLGGDPSLSRRHARIVQLGTRRLLVEDLASSNGTFVNGHRIFSPTVIGEGDQVRLGDTILRVSIAAIEEQP